MERCCDMKGFLSYLILWILRKTNMNGAEISRELEKRRGTKPSPGTIYPALKELKNVGLIKIDVEGYEPKVLVGARETIRQYKPKLCIEIHPPFEIEHEWLAKFLEEMGYSWLMFPYMPHRSYPHILAEIQRKDSL